MKVVSEYVPDLRVWHVQARHRHAFYQSDYRGRQFSPPIAVPELQACSQEVLNSTFQDRLQIMAPLQTCCGNSRNQFETYIAWRLI
jgi:hypothetical protein